MIDRFDPIEARACLVPYADAIDILLRCGGIVGAAVEWREMQEGLVQSPTLRLLPHHAQRLMDDLWNAGLRPTRGRQSEGVTAAQERHLQDMRAIAFHKLSVERPL